MPDPDIITVSSKALLRVLLCVVAVVFGLLLLAEFAGAVATPLVFILLATVLVMGLNPLVVWLEARFGLPRQVGAPLVVLGLLFFLLGFIAVAIPLFVAQGVKFAQTLPSVMDNLQALSADLARRYPLLQPLLQGRVSLDPGQLLGSSGLMSGLVGLAGNVVALLASAALLFILVLFMLMNPEPLLKGPLSAITPHHRPTVERALIRIGSQLGTWLLGALGVSLAVGVLVGLGLRLLGFENAFLFGMVAGFANLIPYIGPWLGIGLPILVALSEGAWLLALGAGGVMLVVQQVDNYLLSPAVYSRTVRLHPASLLMGALIFGSLLGLVGVFLAVPLSIILKALYEEIYLTTLSRPEVADERVAQVVAGQEGEAGGGIDEGKGGELEPVPGPPRPGGAVGSGKVRGDPPMSPR